MPRRKDNEIYKYKLKSGKVKYGFKTYIGTDPETGKAVKPSRQGFDSYKEAEAAKTKLKEEGPSKFTHKKEQKENRKTVQEVYEIWLEVYRADVRGSTLRTRKSNWKNNIEKEFGGVYIDGIDINHLQSFATKLAETHINYRSILNLLHRVIKYAILRDWCDRDPFDKIVMPKKTKAKSKHPANNFYSLSELKTFLECAKKYKEKYYVYFMTVGNLGCRPGEALALKWKNIDFKNKEIFIQHSISTDENGNKIYGPTKTPASVRKVPLSDQLAIVLKEYKEETIYKKGNDFIFHKDNGDFYERSAPDHWITTLYNNYPLRRITPHGFRHTLATLLNNGKNNANIKDIQYLLGHKKASTTMDTYSHFTKENEEHVAESINKLDI
ncbi:tyrosine-type recombinase/integrase [Lactobacillus crispatus]|jgi:possible bacteriophage integrase|uniref:Site-specific integrase n=2 Tax=Lactobacillus crispatus TaxID=47770 RepID=A0A4Q0LY53_9LACO|nr:site-specific integrase [Lactobacillus crispatus]EEJ70367.1 site-specific recombinase, phage integrase family [Lactobacillus crispatus JV-V01]KWU12689.1 integrase [Lactobacillus crispatus]MBG0732645.1 site-specific integrase [Lactobacillus crispatus]MCT7687477.1 site-specific integrase [Lactobacillus crispatus]MCT7742438.1 site-specific integrase [Lactobacillus crispatus]